jgi:eukaryotic-like serine/threonine-protein kinase
VQNENLIGETIAGYHILRLMGEGGTSTVYQASHPQYGTVAVKILKEKLRRDKTAIARFVREARYGTRVNHPNVVRTLEIGEAGNGRHFLATEWAEGELLERYAKRVGPIAPTEVSEIVAQIADAVEAAHAAGIVHRDLKPENVMYDPKSRMVKLLDFGIAMDTEAQGDERLTRAGFFVGTLMYVAPEALSGELVSPQADQYSLATIAYYLLTATLPYVAKSPRELFTQLLSQPPIPINSARKDLRFGEPVEEVMSKALSRNPTDRFPNATIFAEELRKALSKTPSSLPPTPVPTEATPKMWKSIFRFGR